MSLVNTELSLKVKRAMLMIFLIDLYSTKHNTFILKCFSQFTCTNMDGSRKEGGNFLNLLQKDGYPERGGSLRKVGVPTLEETMCRNLYQYGKNYHNQLLEMFTSFYLIFKCVLSRKGNAVLYFEFFKKNKLY